MAKLNKAWVQASLEMSQVDKDKLDEWIKKQTNSIPESPF